MTQKNNRLSFFLAFSIFVFILFSSFSYATISTDWREYSPVNTYITNTNDLNSNGYFNLEYSGIWKNWDSSGLITPTDDSLKFPTELTTKTIGEVQYLFVTDGNTLTIRDKFLNVLNSTISGSQHYSLSIFAPTNTTAKILGVFTNATGNFFSVYDYSTETNQLALNVTSQITSGDYPSQIKCINGAAYYGYNGYLCVGFDKKDGFNSYLITYRDNGVITYTTIATNPAQSETALKGVSLLDANNDGKLEILASGESTIILLNASGTTIFRKNTGLGYGFSDAVFFRNTPSTYKIAYTRSYIGATTAFEFGFLNLDGTEYGGATTSIASGGNNEIKAANIAVVDFYDSGSDMLLIGYSNNTSTKINLYDSSRSINASISFLGVAFPLETLYLYEGYIIAAKLNGDVYPDIIATSMLNNKTSYVIDLIGHSTILTANGNFIPTDLTTDGTTDLVGYNTTALTFLGVTYTNQQPTITSVSYTPANPAVNSKVTITINATDTEDDLIYYYVNCGNGNSTAESLDNTAVCYYNTTGDFTATAYVRDQFHSGYVSSSLVISIGTTSGMEQSGVVGQVVDSVLGIFPDASNLTLSQRMGIVLVVMLFTAIIILFAAHQLSSEGMHSFIVYVILILLVIEYIFFTAIAYIPLGILVIISLVALGFTYLKLRGG